MINYQSRDLIIFIPEVWMIEEYLNALTDERRQAILDYHSKNLNLMKRAAGSSHNHQAWEGGYLDHISECFIIADKMYHTLTQIRSLPFAFDSSLVVLYFHDIEKMYKYAINKEIDKDQYYNTLKTQEIIFSEQEKNALKYIHGEGADYSKNKRIMNELAAFCHCVDTISARVWYQHPSS